MILKESVLLVQMDFIWKITDVLLVITLNVLLVREVQVLAWLAVK